MNIVRAGNLSKAGQIKSLICFRPAFRFSSTRIRLSAPVRLHVVERERERGLEQQTSGHSSSFDLQFRHDLVSLLASQNASLKRPSRVSRSCPWLFYREGRSGFGFRSINIDLGKDDRRERCFGGFVPGPSSCDTQKGMYNRVVLKLSGEALAAGRGFGVDVDRVHEIAAEISEVRELGVDVAIVVGKGNFFRGVAEQAKEMDRVSADHMGMLGTVINALAIEDALEKQEAHMPG